MAGQPSHLKRESFEQDLEGVLWSVATDTSSYRQSTLSPAASFQNASFAQIESVPRVSASFPPRNPPSLRSHHQSLYDRHVLQGPTPLIGVSPNLLRTHASFFSTPPNLTWQKGTELGQKQTMLQSAAITGLPDIGVDFDSGFLSFTQCLQEGMSMNVSDYSDLSKSLGSTLEASSSEYPGFGQQERSAFSFRVSEAREEPSSSFSNLATQHEKFSLSSGLPSSSLTAEAQTTCASGEASTVPSTPNSSLSSSSSDGHDKELSCCGVMAVGKIEGGEPSEKTSDELMEKSTVETVKKQSKPRKKGQKRNRQPRVALVTKSDVEHLEDGYRWRKYGQKAVKNSPFPRSYYRCTNSKCSVKKRVERSFEDPSMVITTYEGQHTHHSPAILRDCTETQLGGEASLDQSPFSFPLRNMSTLQTSFVPNSQASIFHHFDVQPRGQERLQLRGADCPPRPHQQLLSEHITDRGMLEDILPPGVRKLS